jgi:hypothetical protein
VDNGDVIRRAAADRRQAADLLAGLSPEQWRTPSPCAGWTIRELAGHLLMPMEIGVPRLLLGVDVTAPVDDWRIVLDFPTSRPARRGFVPPDRLSTLHLRATDQDWRSGGGTEITGPSEAPAMAISGRPVALADLDGDGVPVLRARPAA